MEMSRLAALLNTAGQGRSGTTNHDETSESVDRVGVWEVLGEGMEEERGR